jgi:hypothetical protein
VNIELLVVPDCPNEAVAATRLRRALDAIGLLDKEFTRRTITSHAEAEKTGFTGSPTILINGQDLFPEPDAAPGLACRIYRTPSGQTGAPEPAQLREALQRLAPLLRTD